MLDKNKKGFTLLELLIVVAMIATMATVATTLILGKAPDYKLRGAAREAYSALQKARSVAVKKNCDTRLLFDSANSQYSLCDDWNTTSSACDGSTVTTSLTSIGAGVGYGHGSSTAEVDGGTFGGASADNSSYSGDSVVFSANGMGDNNGYVYLANQNGNTTYAVGSLTSGSVRIYKWNGSAWE